MASKSGKNRTFQSAKFAEGEKVTPKSRKTDDVVEDLTKSVFIQKVKTLETKLVQFEAVNNLLKDKIKDYQMQT